MDLLIVTRPTVHFAMRSFTNTMMIGELDHLLQDTKNFTNTMMIGELDHLLQDKKNFPNTTPTNVLHHDPPFALRQLHHPRVPTPSSEARQERRPSMWFSLPPRRRMELVTPTLTPTL